MLIMTRSIQYSLIIHTQLPKKKNDNDFVHDNKIF